MTRHARLLALLLGSGLAVGWLACSSSGPGVPPVPKSRVVNQVDDYHGTPVADPYRWLEDPDSPETRAWVEAQNRVTFGWLETVPEREALEARLRTLWNYPRQGPPAHRRGRYFYSKNDGLQDQAVMYWTDGLDGDPRVLIDPNTLSADGTVSLASLSVSLDGTLVAYATSTGGSDWTEWKVREVATGRDRTDLLRWVKFSGAAWTPDGTGFYYSRFPEPSPGEELQQANYNQKLYFHRLGTDQAEDELVYQRPDQPEWGFAPEVTEDGRYLVISAWVGTDSRNRVFYQDLEERGEVRPLLTDFDGSYGFVGNDGPRFYFRSDAGAPRGRLIAVDVRNPSRDQWVELVAEGPDTLAEVSLIADRFVLLTMKDVHHRLAVHRLDGSHQQDIPLPGLGSVAGLTGRRQDSEAFFNFTSFARPSTIYRYRFQTGECLVHRPSEADFDPEPYVTEQVWYQSQDGTRVPMFLVHRRGLERNGKNPTLLYGYGGFNIPILPTFSVEVVAWLERGGLYALPALRGGGEYGEEWHQAGMLEKKQNVFDDFLAAAEWLIAEGYTRSSLLAITGASNGGLLVGACMTQRPDLFGACLPAVGVMDMLRFHKFTIGWAWVPEYGSPEDPEQFKLLYSYSPLHNLKSGTHYPATLITTADHDDRVVPAHSFKFAAALQAAQGGPAPILIRIETRAGHGAGVPTSKRIEEAADRLAFLVQVLGLGR